MSQEFLILERSDPFTRCFEIESGLLVLCFLSVIPSLIYNPTYFKTDLESFLFNSRESHPCLLVDREALA